jgi:hypothetical protein
MLDHWGEFGPPVYVTAAAYLGLGGGNGSSNDNRDNAKYGNLEELASMFQSSGGVIGG